MGLGRRLYDLLRANVNHVLRRPLGVGPEAAPDPRWESPPEAGWAPGPPPRRASDLERAYRALELPWGAGPEAVRKAHRKLLGRYHPDRFARDPERLDDATRLTQELTWARDLLLAALARGEIRAHRGH